MLIVREQVDRISDDFLNAHEQLKKTESFGKKYDYLKELMENIKLLDSLNVISNQSDSIGIGSKFSVSLKQDNYTYTNDYIISEINIPVEGYMVILPNCPLAQSLIGKKKNDQVEYSVSGYKLTATVNEVYKENRNKKIKTKTIN